MRRATTLGLLALALATLTSAASAQQSARGSDELSTASVLQIPLNQEMQLPPDITTPRVKPPFVIERPDPADLKQEAHIEKSRVGKYDVTHIGERGVGSGINIYSLERERAMGRALAEEVDRSSRMISDPAIVDYINRLGQAIVRNSDSRVPFVIRVIDNDEVNAFALPGGYFYVNSGLILAADSEAGLVGVMAHEIAHVAARHATKTFTRAQMYNLASIPLVFVGGPVTYALRQAMGLAVPLSFLKFSRDNEREADLLGMEYAYACGYDPAEFVHFFERLRLKDKSKHHNLIAKAFATHPMTDDRIKRAQLEIQTMLPAKEEYIVTTSEFEQMKGRLARLQHQQTDASGNEVPTLRRRGANSKPSGSKDDEKTSPDDERPRLHRN